MTLLKKVGALLTERRPAHSLPQALYLDPAMHDFDIQAIFQRQWIQAGLEAEIPRPGDYLTHTIGTTSVVVLRNSRSWDGVERRATAADGQARR